MNYHEIIISGRKIKLIPLGDCACGCGGKTSIPDGSDISKKWIKGQPIKFIRYHHVKILRRISGDGHYFELYIPDHGRARKDGYVKEHIVIAEKIYGKPLPKKSVIHHANGNGFDNTPSNLVICENHSYHMFVDQRRRAYEACGHPNWRKCNFCKQYDDPKNFYLLKSNRAHHKKCASDYGKQRYLLTSYSKKVPCQMTIG